MVAVVGTFPDDLVIAIAYDPTGLATATLYDFQVIAWYVDDSGNPFTDIVGTALGGAPRAPGGGGPPSSQQNPPQPEVVGSLPPKVTTAGVVSPQWVRVTNQLCAAPEFRGDLDDFFTFLATNNGANRLLAAQFLHSQIANAWQSWAASNPNLVQ